MTKKQIYRFPVITTDRGIIDRVGRICERFPGNFEPIFITEFQPALEYINYELPEFTLINYSDRSFPMKVLINLLQSDPWLHYGGVVIVHTDKDHTEVEQQFEGMNIINIIRRGNFVSDFYRVLKMVLLNRQLMLDRDLQSNLAGIISGNCTVDNDVFNVNTYTNMITSFLYNLNLIDNNIRENLRVILFELLMNAIEHGNCGITYQEKQQWLDEGNDVINLIAEKNIDPTIRERQVKLKYSISSERSVFTISDQGEGFNWRSYLRKEETSSEPTTHGYGILMAAHYSKNLHYNDAGNAVTFEIVHNSSNSNMLPSIFSGQKEITTEDKEVLFRQGDKSHNLYFIVSGKLMVLRDNVYITTLTPTDMFIGEMSLLLSTVRTATVISEGPCILLSIERKNFFEAIKSKPYYGIMLARLLAGRLDILNRKFPVSSA